MLERGSDGMLRLPALATAHSHAFQRAMRGRAQRPGLGEGPQSTNLGPAGDDFWSWRGQMYGLVSTLTPESNHRISPVALSVLSSPGVHTFGPCQHLHPPPPRTQYLSP